MKYSTKQISWLKVMKELILHQKYMNKLLC